jgi:hypothetical protein
MPEGVDETTPQTYPPGEEAVTPPTGDAVPQGGTGEGTDAATAEGTDGLGDAGKRALDSMKGKWHTERDRRRALEEELESLRAPKPAEDGQPDADAIRREAAREAAAKANARILRSEIKAAAAGKLADPADALAHLDPASFEVDENGDVDAEEISAAITDLLTRKPYLAANSRPRFQGTGDGGAARKPSGPAQLTRADLKGMTPDQIHKAKAEGRLNTVLGIGK